MDAEVRVSISSDADIVIARQEGHRIAATLSFSTSDLTVIATAISEVARNIIEYASRGEIVIRVVQNGDRHGVAVVASDRGPGIPNPSLALQDGYSTSGSLGLGLPGARRLMDSFELKSAVGKGTIVTMHKWARRGAS